MEGMLDNPIVHEIMKTSGPMGLVAMFLGAALWVMIKRYMELEKRLFRISSAQTQSNTRMEAALRALRDIIRERVL